MDFDTLSMDQMPDDDDDDDDDDDERKSVASTHVDELWYNLRHVFHFMDLRSSHMHPRIWQ